MAIDPNRWTLKTQEAFNAAVEQARANSNPEVTPDHLLAAMLGQDDTVVLPILDKTGIAPLTVRNRAEEAVARLPKAYGGEAAMGRSLRDVIERADVERQGLGDEYLSIEHLLLAMADMVHVSKEDLLEALDCGHLSRAVLDVTEPEPLPPEHPFWRHPRVFVTPHVASMTQPETAAPILLSNLRRHQRGEPLTSLIDQVHGY